MQQVITITPDGGMSGLQRRRGQGLDLRQFGRARITRVSEVVWVELYQTWALMIPSYRGNDHLHYRDYHDVVGIFLPEGARNPQDRFPEDEFLDGHSLTFYEYEDAVAAEIVFLDALRLQGEL